MFGLPLDRLLFRVHMAALVAFVCFAWWQNYHHGFVWWQYMIGISGLTLLRIARNRVEKARPPQDREQQPLV